MVVTPRRIRRVAGLAPSPPRNRSMPPRAPARRASGATHMPNNPAAPGRSSTGAPTTMATKPPVVGDELEKPRSGEPIQSSHSASDWPVASSSVIPNASGSSARARSRRSRRAPTRRGRFGGSPSANSSDGYPSDRWPGCAAIATGRRSARGACMDSCSPTTTSALTVGSVACAGPRRRAPRASSRTRRRTGSTTSLVT